MFFIWFLVILFINNVFAQGIKRVVLEEGVVEGEKYWDDDYYEFYGIPYASVPKGKDRFKGPLKPKKWEGIFQANNKNIICEQAFTAPDDEDKIVYGDEDCLVVNVFTPLKANNENLLPVLVYIHSGAFAAGNGNMARYNHLVMQDVVVVSFNFRLGAVGFACLGTESIPGNAGMKDQVAALKWIKKNIIKFGGDPSKITLAGFSVGATMAELLLLSKSTEGLINQMILESGSSLSPYAIDRHPIETAKNIAISIGYNGTSMTELENFYLNTPIETLQSNTRTFFLRNSSFGFAPCKESIEAPVEEPFLTQTPIEILKSELYPKIPVLTGFANMEGISRVLMFDEWSEELNDKFEQFLPVDLYFENNEDKSKVIKVIKDFYFKGEEVTHDNLQAYIDYFSDSMFKYSILKSAKHFSFKSDNPVYFYEFSYVGSFNMKHNFMDKINGASHRDQSSYVLDFFAWSHKPSDLDKRDQLTIMWTDFVKLRNPTAFESPLIKLKWLPFTNEDQHYLQIDNDLKMNKGLLTDAYKLWNDIYEKYSR